VTYWSLKACSGPEIPNPPAAFVYRPKRRGRNRESLLVAKRARRIAPLPGLGRRHDAPKAIDIASPGYGQFTHSLMGAPISGHRGQELAARAFSSDAPHASPRDERVHEIGERVSTPL